VKFDPISPFIAKKHSLVICRAQKISSHTAHNFFALENLIFPLALSFRPREKSSKSKISTNNTTSKAFVFEKRNDIIFTFSHVSSLSHFSTAAVVAAVKKWVEERAEEGR
jgi:hypothetical protein